MVGRQGSCLSAGEDTELCLALRLAGWTLRYDPRLRLIHHLPADRLNWPYLRALQRGFGSASIQLAPYHALLGSRGTWLSGKWGYGYLAVLLKLLRYLPWFWKARWENHEGIHQILAAEWTRAQLIELQRSRRQYGRRLRSLRAIADQLHVLRTARRLDH